VDLKRLIRARWQGISGNGRIRIVVIAKGTNRIFHKIWWEGYVRWWNMYLIAEQAPAEKKKGKVSDPEEEDALVQDWKSITNTPSGDHPYRRRKL
jgi:hypothetical protein